MVGKGNFKQWLYFGCNVLSFSTISKGFHTTLSLREKLFIDNQEVPVPMHTTFIKFKFTTEIHEYPRQVYSKITFILFTLPRYTFTGGKTNIPVLPTLALLSRDLLKKSVLNNTKIFSPFCLRTKKKRF